MLNGQRSNFEKNIFLQPALIREILDAPLPAWMKQKPKRIFFVGIGSNFHVAKISEWLWRRHVAPQAWAVHSFDFVRTPQPVAAGDTVVLLSHRGTKSFTVEAAKIARGLKTVTVALTGRGSPWEIPLSRRLDTCEQEDTGAFTKSLATTLAWIVRWTGSSTLGSEVRRACGVLGQGPDFPEIRSGADLVLLGDAAREWIAREISLKAQEAAYLPARAFGLEEFLHGPRISVGKESVVVAFSSSEPRWRAARDYLETIGAPLAEVRAEQAGLSEDAGWLWQLFWGQLLTLDICRRLEIDPDSLRNHQLPYRQAKEALTL